METNTINKGKALGRKHLDQIVSKSERWKARNIPVYVRQYLMVPYFLTEVSGLSELHVIQAPLLPGERVHFICYARSDIDEAT
jgi:hypothetical protein